MPHPPTPRSRSAGTDMDTLHTLTLGRSELERHGIEVGGYAGKSWEEWSEFVLWLCLKDQAQDKDATIVQRVERIIETAHRGAPPVAAFGQGQGMRAGEPPTSDSGTDRSGDAPSSAVRVKSGSEAAPSGPTSSAVERLRAKFEAAMAVAPVSGSMFPNEYIQTWCRYAAATGFQLLSEELDGAIQAMNHERVSRMQWTCRACKWKGPDRDSPMDLQADRRWHERYCPESAKQNPKGSVTP